MIELMRVRMGRALIAIAGALIRPVNALCPLFGSRWWLVRTASAGAALALCSVCDALLSAGEIVMGE